MKLVNLLTAAMLCLFVNCKNECEKVNCLNGGTCIDGTCNCPERWAGDRCEKQATPKSITVTEIELLKFPVLNPNGQQVWDSDGQPDVYVSFRFQDGSNVFTGDRATRLEDAPPGAILKTSNFKFGNLSEPYEIMLWDYDDPNPDDFIGSLTQVVLYASDNNFPEKIEVGSASSDLHLRLKLQYNFQ